MQHQVHYSMITALCAPGHGVHSVSLFLPGLYVLGRQPTAVPVSGTSLKPGLVTAGADRSAVSRGTCVDCMYEEMGGIARGKHEHSNGAQTLQCVTQLAALSICNDCSCQGANKASKTCFFKQAQSGIQCALIPACLMSCYRPAQW